MKWLDRATYLKIRTDLVGEAEVGKYLRGDYVTTIKGITDCWNNVCFPGLEKELITEEGVKFLDGADRMPNGEWKYRVNSFFYDHACNGKSIRTLAEELKRSRSDIHRHLDTIPHVVFQIGDHRAGKILWSTNSVH